VLSPTASQRVPSFRNEIFFTRSRKPGTHPQDGESKRSADKSRDYAEAYLKYAAQVITQIDAACPGVALAESEDCEKEPFMDGN